MDNDSKTILMQYLYRFAEHYNIESVAPVSFKKRNDLLEKLKDKDHDAWVIMDNLFNAFIKSDRINNDKEKWEKARILWETEHAAIEKEKVNAEMLLIQFCKKNGIQVGAVNAEKQTSSAS
jgi:hypothetical protein